MRSSLLRGAPVVILSVMAGCASAAASLEPTAPERPAVPDGWHEVTSDEGDVRLALPGDFDAIFTEAGIIAQERARNGSPQLEVIASGPADAVPQPRAGVPIRTWLEQSSWLPVAGEGGVTQAGGATEREVALPAGPALEVAITAQPGMPEEGRVVLYAIATGDGIAIIRFVGSPARMDERADELRFIALLAEFGERTDGD